MITLTEWERSDVYVLHFFVAIAKWKCQISDCAHFKSKILYIFKISVVRNLYHIALAEVLPSIQSICRFQRTESISLGYQRASDIITLHYVPMTFLFLFSILKASVIAQYVLMKVQVTVCMCVRRYVWKETCTMWNDTVSIHWRENVTLIQTRAFALLATYFFSKNFSPVFG